MFYSIHNLSLTDLYAVEPGIDLVVLLHEVVERPHLETKKINGLKNYMNFGVEKCSEQGKCNERIRKDKFFEEQTLLN